MAAGRKYRQFGRPILWEQWHPHFSDVSDFPLTGIEVRWWNLDPQLSRTFDITRGEERAAFTLACQSLTGLRSTFAVSQALAAYAADCPSGFETESAVALNNAMHAVWRARPDLQRQFADIKQRQQAAYVLWFIKRQSWQRRLKSLQLVAFTPEFLNAPDPTLPGRGGAPLSRAMHLVYKADQQLQARYDLNAPAQRQEFVDWFFAQGASETGIDQLIAGTIIGAPVAYVSDSHCATRRSLSWYRLCRGKISRYLNINNSVQKRCNATCAWQLRRKSNNNPGLNVVGAFAGNFGFGEHARTTALSAEAVNVQCAAFNLNPVHAMFKYSDQSVEHLISDHLAHAVSVFIGSPRWFVERLSTLYQSSFREPYRVYFGAWELEELPQSFRQQIDCLFHEAWAQSKFQYDCLRRSLRVPVTYMPLAVRRPGSPQFNRDHFALPKDRFLFLYVFDGVSTLIRKNPAACVSAFMKAFPLKTEQVGLVLKTKNLTTTYNLAAARELRELVAQDNRIVVIEHDITREELTALQSVCDAYISLHRAEGFGLTMAESMLLGKPTIATNFSGNTDYCLETNSCLVDYRLVPVDADEFVLGAGQMWAEPDIEHAASYMRRLQHDPHLARKIGQEGANYIANYHSLTAVGQRIKTRLQELAQ